MRARNTVLLLSTLAFLLAGTALFARDLSQAQQQYIDRWLAAHDLNRYGDPEGTSYVGGTPLFDEATGTLRDRYDYVLARHPALIFEIANLAKSAPAGCADAGEALRQLETELERAQKDLALEQHAPRPDKARIEALQRRVSELRGRIEQLLLQQPEQLARSEGVAPEVFSEEVDAALASSDYPRIQELLTNLRAKGPSAVKLEAEALFGLGRQLRFRALQAQDADEVARIQAALATLAPILETLKV